MKRLTYNFFGAKYSQFFEYHILPNPTNETDSFRLSSKIVGSDVVILISGNNGVALASGLNWYMKYYLNSEISWGIGESWKQIKVPTVLPEIKGEIRHQTKFRHRYYLNVCTVSYTMAYWDEDRWVREIDWAAMQGYNEILSFTGQEYVFKRV